MQGNCTSGLSGVYSSGFAVSSSNTPKCGSVFDQLHEIFMVKLRELLTLHQINTYCGSNCTAWNIKYVYYARVEKYRYSEQIENISNQHVFVWSFKINPSVRANLWGGSITTATKLRARRIGVIFSRAAAEFYNYFLLIHRLMMVYWNPNMYV